MSNYTQKATVGSALVFGGIAVASVLAYVLRIVLARFLPVEEVGLYFAAINFIIFITLFQRLGVEAALVHFISKWKVSREYGKISSTLMYTVLFQLGMGAAYALLTFLVSDYLGMHYFKHALAPATLRIFSLLFILLVLEDIPRRIFQSFNKMFWFALVEVLKPVLILLFVIAGFFFETTVLIPVYGFVIATVIIAALSMGVASRVFNVFEHHPEQGWRTFKQVFVFSLPLILLVICNKVLLSIDLLILTYFRDLHDVGVYSAVLPTAALSLLFFRAISVVMLPLGSELWAREEKSKLAGATARLNRYLLISVAPIILTAFAYPELILATLFGPAYASGSTALRILLIGMLFFGLAQLNISIITAAGDSKRAGASMLIGSLASVAACMLLIPPFGMLGAAVATSFGYLTTYYASRHYLKQTLAVRLSHRLVIKVTLASAAFTLTAALLKMIIATANPLAEVCIVLLISSLIYVCLIHKMRLFTFAELKGIANQLSRSQ